MSLLAVWISYLFKAYIFLLLIRVIGSWFPSFAAHPIMRLIYQITEPYLGFFRRIIPPIGGVLDLSPLIGFFALEIMQSMVLRLML